MLARVSHEASGENLGDSLRDSDLAASRSRINAFGHCGAMPQPTVPVVSVILVALGALVVANLVAALPARRAAQTSPALILRTS